MPGLIAGWLLAFIVSQDDFIISSMLSGPGSTVAASAGVVIASG